MAGRVTADEKLFTAIQNDNSDDVRNLLLPEVNISAKNEDGYTVLHLAAEEGRESLVELLTETDRWKEIVDVKDALGRTALHNCCIRGHTKTIELLLANKANVAATDEAGWTALHCAVDEGDLSAVQCLVKHPQDLDQKTNTTGGTALHMAAIRGYAKIVDELVDNGASITATAWDGESVLHWALRGAISARSDHDGEDEAGHQEDDESHNSELDDEVVNFGDSADHRSVHFDLLSEHFESQERARDTANQFDKVFERILRDLNEEKKWSELLKVARREEKMETLQYLLSKMYSREIAEAKEKPLRRIWLAMSEAKSQELMEMLWIEAREARTPEVMTGLQKEADDDTEAEKDTESMKKWDSMEKWDILSLATSLGKVQTVYWLLRGRRWSKSDIDKARNLPNCHRVNKGYELRDYSSIWDTPFVHDERSGGERYRWPDQSDSQDLNGFGATIMDFHKVDNQIVSMCYDCDTWSLIHSGEDDGPKKIMEQSRESLQSQQTGGVATNEYSDKSHRYRWVHIPINSIPWMKDLALISYLERKAKSEQWMATWQFLRRSWQELPENRDEEPYMRSNCVKANSSQQKFMAGEQSLTPKNDESLRLALYMPYLTFGPLENTSPHDERLRKEHEGGILHRSRTLDQFYHGRRGNRRDDDQVFTRYADVILNRKREKDTKFDILRVNQLWLWVLDEKTVITSTTHGVDEDPVFQGFLKRLFQSQTIFTREATPSSVDSFVKLITSFYINALDNLKVSLEHPREQNGGEHATSQGADQDYRPNNTTDATKTQTASLTTVFARSIEFNNDKEKKLRDDFRHKMEERTSMSGNLHNSITQVMEILDDIKDIRGELNTINSVIQEQRTVWSQLFNRSRDSSMGDHAQQEGHHGYQWSNTDPDYVLKRVKDLLHEAEETEHNITSVLELKMNQLSLSEAENSRKQGEVLMVFTIVTVLFLPLSFLSSMFALNVSTFPHSGNDLRYQPEWIFSIMFGATLAFILLLLPFIKKFREAFFNQASFVGGFFKAAPGVITERLKLQPKPAQSTEPQRDESKQAAEAKSREPFKKWWRKWWRPGKPDKPDGELATV